MSSRQSRLRATCATLCTAAMLHVVQACGGSSTGPAKDVVHEVVITPDSVGLNPGGTKSLSAIARDAAARPVANASFFWSTNDSLVATVTQTGGVTAHRPGVAQIGASSQGHSGFASVVVVASVVHTVVLRPATASVYGTAPGNSTTLVATTYDAGGNVITGHPLLWSSSSGVATVANGVVTASGSGAGTAMITATSPDSGFPAGSATVSVLGHVATVDVSPAHSVVSTSGFYGAQSVQLSAKLTDTFGTDVSATRSVKWSSGNASIARVDAKTGVVTGASSAGGGPIAITATTPDNKTGTASVFVVP